MSPDSYGSAQGKKTSTRKTTSILKGLAILVVLVAHYSSHYAYAFYERRFTEYGSEAVSIFFVLSGFGLYYSLRKRFSSGDPTGRLLLKFAYSRAVRIYPLYWLALMTISLFYMPSVIYYNELYHDGLSSVLIWLGVPFIRNNELWFITAILQCYWVAPLFYVAMRKLGTARFALAVAGITGLSLIFTGIIYLNRESALGLPEIDIPMVYYYRGFLLGNLILFAMGMLIAPLAEKGVRQLRGWSVMGAATVALLFLAWSIRVPDKIFIHSELWLIPLFYVAVTLFCLTAIENSFTVPAGSLFAKLGDNSYTVYLFHYQFMALLGTLGLLASGRLSSPFVALASLPMLLVICIGTQKLVDWPRIWLEKKAGERWHRGETVLAEAEIPAPEAEG